VGQQPRRDAPGAVLARDRPARARREGHPDRHRHAAHAHHRARRARYLEFKPHTDLAIANGIAHLLLERGTYDKDFVEKHCASARDNDIRPRSNGEAITFEEYGLARPYTPEHVERSPGVPRTTRAARRPLRPSANCASRACGAWA
jgi:anaerobic selenocysteine-containing dehydrogenase